MKNICKMILGLSLIFSISFTQEKLLILPIHSNSSLDDLGVINLLIIDSFEELNSFEIIYSDSLIACENSDCALKEVEKYGGDKVVFQTINKLGAKLLYSAVILNQNGEDRRSERISTQNIEDFENISSRIVATLINESTFDETANVDNIISTETDTPPMVRQSLNRVGLSLGYAYPIGNSHDRRTCDFFNDDECEIQDYPRIFKLSLLYNYELINRDASVNVMGHWFVPHGIGFDFSLIKFLNHNDFSPFFGAGIGLYNIGSGKNDDKKNSGFGINLQTGCVMLRSYDINLIVRGTYYHVFNSDFDHGVNIELGTIAKRKPPEKRNPIALILYPIALLFFMSVISN